MQGKTSLTKVVRSAFCSTQLSKAIVALLLSAQPMTDAHACEAQLGQKPHIGERAAFARCFANQLATDDRGSATTIEYLLGLSTKDKALFDRMLSITALEILSNNNTASLIKLEERFGNSMYNNTMHSFAQDGDARVVRTLLSRRVDPNQRNINGALPLNEAIWQLHADIVQALVDGGADTSLMDLRGDPVSERYNCDALGTLDYVDRFVRYGFKPTIDQPLLHNSRCTKEPATGTPKCEFGFNDRITAIKKLLSRSRGSPQNSVSEQGNCLDVSATKR